MRKSPVAYFNLLFICILFLAACKDRSNRAGNPIIGLWMGETSNKTTSQPYTLVIMPEGKLIVEGNTMQQEQFGAGHWELNGSEFSARVVTLYGFKQNEGVVQELTATYDESSGQLDGITVSTVPVVDTGRIFLQKID